MFTYAVSRIRAIEKNLLNMNDFDRLIQSKSKSRVVQILEEMEYGLISESIDDNVEVEDILSQEQVKVYRLLNELEEKGQYIRLFMYVNDYFNTKVILKAEFTKSESINVDLLKTGVIPVENLKTFIMDRKLNELPEILHDSILECLSTLNRVQDPQVIDIVLDRGMYKQMYESALELKNDFITEYIKTLIDFKNINSWLRIRRIKKTWNFLQKVLIDNGFIDKKVFIDNIDTNLESFIERFQYTKYSKVIEDGLNDYIENKSFEKIEKLVDNYIIDLAKSTRYISFGIEPLIAYKIFKEIEIKNLRIVMIGITNNVPSDIIYERLRDVYV